MTLHTCTSAVTLIALLLTMPSEAWCNKREQPGGAVVQDDFEVPEPTPTVEPFTFEAPDPRRRLRQLDYALEPNGQASFLVVLGTDLNAQQVSDIQQGVLGLLMGSFCHPLDELEVFSGLRRITTFRNHPRVTDCGETWAKFRIQNNASAIGTFNQFIQEQKEASGSGSARLDLDHVVHHIGQAFHSHPEGNRTCTGSAENRLSGFTTCALHRASCNVSRPRAAKG